MYVCICGVSFPGTSGVPIQGFGYLQGNDGNVRKFTLHGDKNVKVFPRAHTCFNRIDLPIYKVISLKCPTYTHTYIHTFCTAYTKSLVHSYMHACIFLNTYIHTYIHVHRYLYTYINTANLSKYPTLIVPVPY